MLLFLHQILKVEENKQHLQENLTLIQLISCLFQLALLNNKNLHSRSVFKMFPNTLLWIRWHKNLNTSLKICQNLISWLIDINGVQEICGLERRCQIHTLLGTDPPSANEPTLNEGMGHSGHSLYYPSDTTIVASGFYTYWQEKEHGQIQGQKIILYRSYIPNPWVGLQVEAGDLYLQCPVKTEEN